MEADGTTSEYSRRQKRVLVCPKGRSIPIRLCRLLIQLKEPGHGQYQSSEERKKPEIATSLERVSPNLIVDLGTRKAFERKSVALKICQIFGKLLIVVS